MGVFLALLIFVGLLLNSLARSGWLACFERFSATEELRGVTVVSYRDVVSVTGLSVPPAPPRRRLGAQRYCLGALL